jgi:DUF971 family protein
MPYPQALRSDANTGTLEIVWDDNTRQELDGVQLRRACPCADCKSLQRQHGNRGEVPAAAAWEPHATITIQDIRLVGTYAAQIIFSDGHDRGIFPWLYLKGLKKNHQE